VLQKKDRTKKRKALLPCENVFALGILRDRGVTPTDPKEKMF